MSVRLYHGSPVVVQRPEYGKGRKRNDYGQGFYTTLVPELGKEWAVDADRDGFLNIYDFDTQGLKIVDLNQPCYSVLHWMALLYANRDVRVPYAGAALRQAFLERFLPDISEADVVIGYRADDRYSRFARDFILNIISAKELLDILHLGNLGQQFFIQSPTAFARLSFVHAEEVSSSEWFASRQQREHDAAESFNRMKTDKGLQSDGSYIRDILSGTADIRALYNAQPVYNGYSIPEDCILIQVPCGKL